MKRRHKILLAIISIIMVLNLTGCASIRDFFSKNKEKLIGQKFEISTFDHNGNKTLTVKGNKVTVGLLENNANFDSESDGFKSSVLEITVDGNQMFQVGNTAIFAEEGLDMVEGYEVPENIETSKGGGFVPLDRFVNDIKNKIGKDKTIIVSSQLGIPIGVYQGNSVYVTVPDSIPKTTRLNIDGKSLYIHRANYTILDSNMMN